VFVVAEFVEPKFVGTTTGLKRSEEVGLSVV
jgi:hypothetical protein